MNVLIDAIKIIAMVVAVLLIVPAALAFVAYVGYFFGIVLAYLASYVLVGGGVSFETIPVIIAWLFVASSIISLGSTAKSGDSE